jgi:hypothetical protein
MICAQHNWWDAEISCPECATELANPAAVTGAETALTEMPDIPDFLVRAPDDGTFLRPRPRSTEGFKWSGSAIALSPTDPVPKPWSEWTEAELYTVLDETGYSLIERQPIYMELRRREDRKKSLVRIADMKDKKAAKEDAPK